MDPPVHLEHRDPAVGQVPLGVGVAPTALTVPSQDLTSRRHQTRSLAEPADVDLGDGLGAAGEVDQDAGEHPGSTERPHPWQPRVQGCGGGELLLHGRREHTGGRALGARVGSEQQQGGLEQ